LETQFLGIPVRYFYFISFFPTQVLKDCAWGREASITVQRGGAATPTKNKWKKGGIKDQDQQQQQQPPVSPRKPPVGAGLFRSKTPTADLYRFVPRKIRKKITSCCCCCCC
jgi:hypothetical protein